MQITVINVANQTVPTSKGSYQALEVTYKGVDGKVGSKKIMSFVAQSKAAFETLSAATNGEVFTISQVKDAQDKYWVWTDATKGAAGGQATASTGTTSQSIASGTQPKGNWETAEERAKKQIYIIRQSSVSSAVNALSVGSKTAPKLEDVLSYAKGIENYVFDGLTGNFAEDTASLEDEDLFQSLPQ